MKQIISTLIFVLCSTFAFAQSMVSYDNFTKLWKLQSASAISSQVKEWKFRILNTEESEGVNSVTWTNGKIYKNDYDIENRWTLDYEQPYENICCRFKNREMLELMWSFQSETIFNSLKQQLMSAGWRYEDDMVIKDGLCMRYSSQTDALQILTLSELIGGRFSISIINKDGDADNVKYNNDGTQTYKKYDIVEQQPTFNGNINEWLANNLKYPPVAAENGIDGRVLVQFIVGKDGSIHSAQVIRGVDSSLDKEALRLVNSMPKWTPARKNGEAVDCKYTFPVVFRLF